MSSGDLWPDDKGLQKGKLQAHPDHHTFFLHNKLYALSSINEEKTLDIKGKNLKKDFR